VQERPPLTLRDALAHKWLLILAVVAVFVLGAGVLSMRPRTYAATAEIYLDTARTAPGFDLGVQTGELLQHDFIVLATSRSVLRAVCGSPGMTCSPAELTSPETTLARRVSAGVYKGTSTLTVTAKGPTPTEAADLANAVAQAMIDQDRAEVDRLFKPIRDDLQKQLTDLAAAMDNEQQLLQQSPPASSAAAGHQAKLGRLQTQYSQTFTRLQDVTEQKNRASNVATIAQSAAPPLLPAAPSPRRYLLAALLAGLCVGVLAALLVERWDDRIFNAESLARATNSPVTLVTPRDGRHQGSPDGAYSLALASLLTGPSDARTFLVAGASPRDHSSAVAASLGAVAAHAGQRVVVIESDGQAVPRSDVAGMTTITAPHDGGPGITAALTEIRKQHNIASPGTVVLVAVPSPDTSPSALLIGRTAKRAVVTATAGRTRFGDARRTADLLRHAGVEVVAGILLARPVRVQYR
jgi:capsular polysaccharide biosynthesis protein